MRGSLSWASAKASPPPVLHAPELDIARHCLEIQSLGAIIVLDLASGTIEGMSENAGPLIGAPAANALGHPLDELDPNLADNIRRAADPGAPLHVLLDSERGAAGERYDIVAHSLDRRLLIEFLPNTDDAGELKRKLRTAICAAAAIRRAESFEDALQIACDAARRVTGFERVKVCRFEPDRTGRVIAESLATKTTPSFLDLIAPAGDFPAGARALFERAPHRALGAVRAESLTPILTRSGDVRPFDLALSLLRPVTPAFAARLGEIGVSAALSTSLIYNGQLWGVILCHSRDEHWAPFDDWRLARDIGGALMERYARSVTAETMRKTVQIRAVEALILGDPGRRGDIRKILGGMLPMLQDILDADGCALLCGEEVISFGEAPPVEMIRELGDWVEARASDDVFSTTRLHAEWPGGKDHVATACGALMLPVGSSPACRLVWFRRPATSITIWCGRPPGETKAAKTPTGPGEIPTWETVKTDESRRWREAEVECARRALSGLLDTIVAHGELFAHAGKDARKGGAEARTTARTEARTLREYVGKTAHDIRGPLRAINYALSSMQEHEFAPVAVKDAYRMAETASVRIIALVNGLLELSHLYDAEPLLQDIEMNDLIGELWRESVAEASAKDGAKGAAKGGAKLVCKPLPKLRGDRKQIRQLFERLFENAIAYRAQDRPLEILIEGKRCGDDVTYSISDNGVGVREEFAEAIFEPLRRLHAKDVIEGAGLGLTICRRIALNHGGEIRLEATEGEGARFVVTLPAGERGR